MRFDAPWWFAAALMVLAGAAWIVAQMRRGRRSEPAVLFSNVEALAATKPTWRIAGARALGALNVLVLLVLIAALARPQKGKSDSIVYSEGVDIVLVVDTSGSMAAQDFGQGRTRLWHVKEVMKNFVKGRESDRIGLVSFGAHAYTRCPMTLDYDLLEGFLENVHSEWERAHDSLQRKVATQRDPRLTPQELDLQATAIGDALVAAIARLEGSKAKSRIIILLTDGESNAGEIQPSAAADLAKEQGVRIYCVGAGSNRQAIVAEYNQLGQRIQRPQAFRIDEAALEDIAERAGGRYFPAQDRQALEEGYAEIARLERSEVHVKDYREWDERFQPLAWAALALLCLHALAASTIFRTVP
jgi:Ca-activated chloride channel homolog